jgi:CRP/FNR family transcriptional regulator, cyclic AMP receptor protein
MTPAPGAGLTESPSLQLLMRRSWDRPTERDWADVLGALPLFSGLRKRQVRSLAKLAKVIDYAPNEAIVRVGERGDSFYLILEGKARVSKESVALGAGDFFGEMALIDGGERSRTITATTPVRVMRLPRSGFLKAIDQDPKIALAIMGALAQRLRRLDQKTSG